MIQDIFPHKIDNQFRDVEVTSGDYVIGFEGNEAWVCAGSEDRIEILTYDQIKDQVEKEDLHYGFSIDDKRYFLDFGFGKKRVWEGAEKIAVRAVRRGAELEERTNCFAIQTAWHLYVWYSNSQYCGRCGTKTEYGHKERNMICPKCRNQLFPRIQPAVIIGVTNKDKLLMSKYAGNGFKNYALIAGFMEIGETAEECVAREVMEEVGVKVKNIRYYKTQPWGLASDILLGYYCDLDGEEDITLDKNELSTAGWFDRDEIPENDNISLTYEMMGRFKHHPELFE